jgi:hypothetical protein
MTDVYLVSVGSYSDYSIEAVFTDEALATAHAAKVGGTVEPMPLLDKMPTRFTVYCKSNDTYKGREPHEWTYVAWTYQRRLYQRANVSVWNNGRSIRVHGWDKGAVDKAFDDRYAQLQAEREGIA